MGQSSEPKHAATDRERIASGHYGDVWLFGDALSEWKAVCRKKDQESRRAVRRLEAYFSRFATLGMKAFPEEHFKSVDRVRAQGGTEYLIYEFKSHQFRLYGVVRQYNGKRCFIGLVCDPAKKNNKANPRILKRAANAADRINGE